MQNKGAIKFFAIAFALVCLFQLSFTFVTTKVEKDAQKYANNAISQQMATNMAQGDAMREGTILDSIEVARSKYYLDSISNEVVFNILLRKYTYKECLEREINLGLDLKGGMDVTLEIKVADIIRALSGDSKDPVFVQALAMVTEKQKDSQKDFVTLFGESFNEIDPNAQLSAIFTKIEFRDRIKYNSTNEEVMEIIREETNGAVDRAFNILNTRINRFGVAQPNIQRIPNTGRILVQLPGIKDPDRVRKLLQGTAQLEFWENYRFNELQSFFSEANTQLASLLETEAILNGTQTAEETESINSENVAETTKDSATSLLEQLTSDSAVQEQPSKEQSFAEYEKTNPLYAVLTPAFFQNQQGQYVASDGAAVGYAYIKDTAKVNSLLAKVPNIFPRDLKLAWTNKPEDYRPDMLELIALKSSRDGGAAMFGDVVVDARQDYAQNGSPSVTLGMNADGSRDWKRLTGENVGRPISIVLDDYVYTHPNVGSEISGGRTEISGGSMTIEEAKDLANILKAGKLPAPASIIEENIVGPSLGQEAINAGLWSFVIAFVLVLFYMLLYYNKAGMISDLALLTNIFFLFGVLASLGAVLTLPGIAGIVLTLGMAVDANVIIYERIKEEIRAGKGMRLAIQDGYRNAYSAIIDGNVTTLLTGIVLYVFGSGPVQGFATTLIIGIVSSLFTAIFISRLIFDWMLNKNMTLNFANNFTKDFLAHANFDFLKMRKITYILSSVIIILGIGSLVMRGLNYGVDFSGGRTYVVRFDQDVSVNEIRQSLTAQFANDTPEVKTFGPSKQVKITTKYMIEDAGDEVDGIIQNLLFTGLKPFYADQGITYSRFSTDVETNDKLIGILSSQKVGPTIADDIRNKSIMAITFALIVIFLYIAVRFKRWQFGLGGVVALFHDTIITVSLFSILYSVMPFNLEIDQAFIAAILTIIGYSINDTVIIFDRIREVMGLYPKKALKDNMNSAINSTLARTLNTAGTTLVVLLAIFLFGGDVIRGFIFALTIGIIVGTYSSVFIASPIAYDLIGEKSLAKITAKLESKAEAKKK